MNTAGHCIFCESFSHWIEIIIRDEHNQPFDNIKGTLYAPNGIQKFPITVGEDPILIKNLAPGKVYIELDYEQWLNNAQKRAPFDGEKQNSPVDLWLNNNPTGYLETDRQLFNITVGDLAKKPISNPYIVEDEGKVYSDLSTRQKAGMLDELKLETDKSYFLKVRGSNYITLRFGMFFDGTGNNTYSSTWGLNEYENYYSKWKRIYDSNCSILAKKKSTSVTKIKTKELGIDCFKMPNSEFYKKSAVCNEPTNVQKLHDLYCSPENHTNYNKNDKKIEHAIYITGVGTENCDFVKSAEESNWGAGLGINKFGVNEKTERGMDLIIDFIKNEFVKIIDDSESVDIDGVGRFEFDVFGFSRGAAVARNFINYLFNKSSLKKSYEKPMWLALVNEELNKLGLPLASFFNIEENRSCEVMFAGIYDTVCSVANIFCGDFSNHNDYNPLVKLWVDPKRVRKLIHLTADPNIEVRWNFCLNKINEADNFKEYTLFGAHSDIGGGYIASPTLSKDDYYLPMYENKVIYEIKFNETKAIFTPPTYKNGTYNDVEDLPKSILMKYKDEIDEYVERECSSGWKKDNYVITLNSLKSPLPNQMNEYIYTLSLQRFVLVDGLLPRLYLRLMFGLAKYYDVPLDDNKGDIWKNKTAFKYYYVPDSYRHPDQPDLDYIQFGKICDSVLEMAKNGIVHPILESSEFLDALKDHNLIHHSSAEGLVNEPTYDKDKQCYHRKVFSCSKGQ
ncbi:DUF2235 domain-containing protein [Vibrio tritonius]|uniref:DUF2235 domain-containing protein n=1 Tax=Vibrio tritonius TaxID=1435069 RepID=A0ABS7YQC7_9VIBR|nr:DUF2235 domain-containing protein [Vibrio tritonius]MCA2017876.1 DUF2235 domain-containing protein [Vibrio tritonius]